MDLAHMGVYLEQRFSYDLFRLETLPYYRAASDGGDFDAYLRGEPEPNRDAKEAWLGRLHADTHGPQPKRWRKVHIVRGDLSDYERYEFEWGFRDTVAAGEDVRILEVTGESDLAATVGDFFVVDDRHVVLTHYGADGRHVGAEVVNGRREAGAFIAVRDLVWSRAVPFTDWWAKHPQFHRATQAA